MEHLTFLRRKALGAGSLRGISSLMDNRSPDSVSVRLSRGQYTSIVRNDLLNDLYSQRDTGEGLLVRWGCTSHTHFPLEKQLNKSQAIQFVADKEKSRMAIQAQWPDIVPPTINSLESTNVRYPLVVRPSRHAQGRNLFVVNTFEELVEVTRKPCMSSGWYASELINKVAEYRIYVIQGRVAAVAQKTPDNPDQVAWNTAQGGRFDNVRWGSWPLKAVEASLKVFPMTGLDFAGVDVMVDEEGDPYILEVNSAPSLPLTSTGMSTYRHKCMANCFKYIAQNGKDHFEPIQSVTNWRDAIHPAIL